MLQIPPGVPSSRQELCEHVCEDMLFLSMGSDSKGHVDQP